MSKFINNETIEFLKAKEQSTIPQQIQNIRERLNLEAEVQSASTTKIERDLSNQSQLISHIGTNILEMQKIVDNKHQYVSDAIDQIVLTQHLNSQNLKRQALIVTGVALVWLITLSILILKHA